MHGQGCRRGVASKERGTGTAAVIRNKSFGVRMHETGCVNHKQGMFKASSGTGACIVQGTNQESGSVEGSAMGGRITVQVGMVGRGCGWAGKSRTATQPCLEFQLQAGRQAGRPPMSAAPAFLWPLVVSEEASGVQRPGSRLATNAAGSRVASSIQQAPKGGLLLGRHQSGAQGGNVQQLANIWVEVVAVAVATRLVLRSVAPLRRLVVQLQLQLVRVQLVGVQLVRGGVLMRQQRAG